MASNTLVEAMNRELKAVSVQRLHNDDLLRGVLSGCGDCIKILDLDGRLQFMSEGGKRVMEVEDFGPLKGCPWPDFWAAEGNTHAAAAIVAAKAGKTYRFKGAANTAKGTPRYWDVQVSPIFDEGGKISQLLSISKDITEEWEAAERELFLTQELEHRAKNTFSMVMAIANQTFRGDAHTAALNAYTMRVSALARAHDITRSTNWTSAPIAKAVDAALEGFRTGDDRFSVSGSANNIAPRQAFSLTLALNELATNALKYGALSSPDGRVDISWSDFNDEPSTFRFLWREHSGNPVTKPTRAGFGTRVIKEFLASGFGGEVRLSYEPEGFVCEMQSPLKNLPS